MTPALGGPDRDPKPPRARLRWYRLAAVVVFFGGCAVTQTMVDKMNVEPLSATPFHRQLTAKTQCMHCHTEAQGAPPVPHPQYKKCASCHVAD